MFSNLEFEADDDILVFLDEWNEMESSEFLQQNSQARVLYFNQFIRSLHDGDYSYLEAIVEFAKIHDIEYEQAIKLITPDLKARIEEEAINSKMLKRENVNKIGL